MDNFNAETKSALETAGDAVYEVLYRHLIGERATDETHDLLWSHLAKVVTALSVMQDETPQSIAEQTFGYVPTDNEWRNNVLPRLRRAAADLD
jgi:hypothetical protein